MTKFLTNITAGATLEEAKRMMGVKQVYFEKSTEVSHIFSREARSSNKELTRTSLLRLSPLNSILSPTGYVPLNFFSSLILY